MRLKLDYDRGGLEIEVPEPHLAGVLEQDDGADRQDEDLLIRRAFTAPLGTPPLEALARARRSACVVLPDVTRPLPCRRLLPPVLSALERGGMPRDRITLLIATGLHRPCEGAELEEMVGPEIASGYRILNHYARRPEDHVYLGETTTEVPIHVDRRYCEAGLKVILGLVEPHFMAGFSGGRKLVCPGLCAEQTIRRFHRPELIEHPRSANCVLEGNPTHRTCTEIARRAGVDFSINTVLDSRRRLAGVTTGDLELAFEAAARQAAAEAGVPIAAPAEILIVSGGGYPLDTTWYQSIKGLVAALPAVRRGGTIILASGLREGIGSAEFRRLLGQTRALEDFMSRIRQPGVYDDEQWQLEEFVLAARHARILLYSDGLPREVQRGLFVEPVASVGAGLSQALAEHGAAARVIVMPHGPYLLPVCAELPQDAD